ncbi:hypothetical protein B0H19DRAFT_1059751 [Mycena capillaripes]|nr:hypothetical protein B0H19DRAFT_1059751 [Mycena capillaripes]
MFSAAYGRGSHLQASFHGAVLLAGDSPTSLVLAFRSRMVVSALQQPQTMLFTGKLVSAVLTLTMRNPANPNEVFWTHEGYTSYFRQPHIAPKSANLARLKTTHPGIKLWLCSDYKRPTSTQRQRLKKAVGATNHINGEQALQSRRLKIHGQ